MNLADSLDGRTTALIVCEIAALLSISERQVYKLAADGRVPCLKIGNSIRFDPSAIAAWLRATEKLGPLSVDIRGRAQRDYRDDGGSRGCRGRSRHHGHGHQRVHRHRHPHQYP